MSVNFVNRCEFDNKIVADIADKISVPLDIAKLLVMRGVTDVKSANEFLNPSKDNMSNPFDIAGMREAKERIEKAIKYDEKVVIYGDYDCDGICAISILYSYLKKYISRLNYFVPNRKGEGYGLHNIVIDDLADIYSPDLLITVDCGITSFSEVEYIKKLGIDVIVTDHHEPQLDIPNCIVVNPKVQKIGFYDFCGAGVVFKLVEALSGRENALQYIEIVALATIADIVPLLGENRIIAKLGLDKVNTSPSVSIKILRKRINVECFTAYDIMFKVAPRLNAAGRMGDATRTVDLFISDDEKLINSILDDIEIDNQNRKKLSEDTLNHILKKLKNYDLAQNKIIIMYDKNWDTGILGIVASRIAEMFYRPVVLFNENNGVLRGSARSIRGINIFDCLSNSSKFFDGFGGHSSAAGITMKTENFDAFVQSVNEYVLDKFSNELFYPNVYFDLILNENNCTLDFVKLLDKFEPTGYLNPQPTFLCKNKGYVFAQIGKTNHIKYKCGDLEFLGFNMLDIIDSVNSLCSFTVTMSAKTYMNRAFIQGIMHYVSINEVKNVDDELICTKYIEQSLIEKCELSREVLPYIESEFDNKNCLYGNLFIAFSFESFDNFYKKAKEQGWNIFQSVARGTTVNPLNRLILMPELNYDMSYYKNIILIDKPLNNNYIAFLQKKYIANIYLFNGKSVNINNIRKYRCVSDDEYREIYKALHAELNLNVLNLKDITNKLKTNGHNNFSLFKIASTIYIMIELGIANINNNFELHFQDSVKNLLKNSSLYNTIKEI
ncbi:MAG: single-stranded-DNA-specific exonuclease RecJ [Clostridia bacterium]